MTDRNPVEGKADELPGKVDADGWRRLHPLSPLLRGGIAALVILGIIVSSFRDRIAGLFFSDSIPVEGEGGEADIVVEGDVIELYNFLQEQGLALLAIGALFGVIVLIVLIALVSWWFATYRISDEAVENRQGVLFRKHRRAPLERIQSVNLQRSMLARLLGMTKVQIVTAGQGGKVELAYLGYGDAKLVREQILRRAAEKLGEERSPEREAAAGFGEVALAQPGDPLTARAQEFIDDDVDLEALKAATLVRVPVGRLIGSIFLSWEMLIMLAVLIAVVVGSIVGSTAILFGLIPMVIAWVSMVASMFNKGFNFRLSRGRDSVRTGSGLTSTVTESIPFGRIHAVEAKQPLFWRPLGWWKVRITTAGHSVAQAGQNLTQNVVLPVGPESDVLRVLDTLLPGIGDEPHETEGLSDALAGPGAGYTGAGRRAFWVLLWGRRRAGVELRSDDTLRVRRGVLTRSLSIMPLVRAQSVQLARPLVHRMIGLASLQAHTVLGPVRMEMRGLDLEQARDLFDELESAVLRVQGTDASDRASRIRRSEARVHGAEENGAGA